MPVAHRPRTAPPPSSKAGAPAPRSYTRSQRLRSRLDRPRLRVLGAVLLLLALSIAASQVIDYLLANGIEGLLDLVAIGLAGPTFP